MKFVGNLCWEQVDDCHIAEGGNSFVYKVFNEASEEHCALKLFKFENTTGERYERFINEIDIVKELSSVDGCISYIDHGFIEDKPFYVMPFYENGTYRSKYFHGSSIEADEATQDFLKVLQIVKSIHAIGLAVRDIKPQNILIDGYGNPVLADFGLSLWVDHCDEDRNTPEQGMVGSQGYRPPEWHTRYPELNHKPGDIWALGRTFWAMLAGCNPPNNYETLGGNGTHLNQYVDKSYANVVQSLVSVCTSQDPDKRLKIDELIEQVKYVRQLIEESKNEQETHKEAIAQKLSKFHLQVSNSEAYIDSQRLESEMNIKMDEINNSSDLLVENLENYAKSISAGVPNDLGKFSIIKHMPAGVFLDSKQLNIDVSENRSWGKVIQLRYTPSEMMTIHKSLEYVDLSFYIGLTKAKNFYWIVQVRDQTVHDVDIIEQIEPKSLIGVVTQKLKQLDEFVGSNFLTIVEQHFKA
ncbi:serine/threonine-protein kinase [Photobacterium leiognathi]|uniref:serine/threonine-protein kinase n=1 Tax=Photobacterium leiognathi TaxID=553611 RepID=UPI002981424F|nr:serine/threonine-protein kinase [Photobacterium leiognathi]